jgi:DNA-binding transcriptional LysR family regulator
MNLQQLRTFRAVAELGSLSRAADRLHTVQPALSRHIKLLEHELKVILFSRTRRGMVLTDAGKSLLERTEGLIKQIEQLRADVQSAGGAPVGDVAIGVLSSISHVIAGRLAQRVLETLPGVNLRLVEGSSDDLVDRLHRGEMDIAILYRRTVDLHFRTEMLAHDEYMIVGRSDSDLAEGQAVRLEWLVGRDLVLPSLIRSQLDGEAAKRNMSLTVRVEANSSRVLVELVKLGLGLTILPMAAVHADVRAGLLTAIPLRDPILKRSLMLAFANQVTPTLAAESVTRSIRDEFAALAAEGLWQTMQPTE